MLLTVLSLTLSLASAADLDEDGCEDSFDTANGACVDPDAVLAGSVTVGANAVVGAFADIGADTALGADTFVGSRSTLVGRSTTSGARPVGADTVIGRSVSIGVDHSIGTNNTIGRAVQAGEYLTTEANVAIGYGTTLGNNVTLRSGSVIGNVAGIGANTELGASAVVGRGVTILDSTGTATIAGTIGPNVSIGADNSIASTSRIRKSATLGNDVTVLGDVRIARNAIIGDGVTIGANARIGVGATVTATSIVPPGTVVPRGETFDDPTGLFSGGSLLSSAEMAQINGWVGDPDADWTLCFKGTVDGFNAAAFHSGCDGIAGTVTVVEESGGKKFGGYTPLLWNHAASYRTESPRTSFLFSLTNNYKHLPYRFANDIYAHSTYGPTFGGGHDLLAVPGGGGSPYCNLGHDYQCRVGSYGSTTCRNDFCGTYSFSAVEVEVYGRD